MEEEQTCRSNFKELVKWSYSAYPPYDWIKFLGCTHLMIYTTTATISSVAMVLSTAPRLPWGGLADSSRDFAPYLFVPSALSLPLYPAVGLQWIMGHYWPHIKWHKMNPNDSGDFGIFVWMEIIVLSIFALLALLLLNGLKEKSCKCLYGWMSVSVLSFICVVVETIIFLIDGLNRNITCFEIGAWWVCLGHPLLSLFSLVVPLGAVQSFLDEVRQEEEDERQLQLSGDICL